MNLKRLFLLSLCLSFLSFKSHAGQFNPRDAMIEYDKLERVILDSSDDAVRRGERFEAFYRQTFLANMPNAEIDNLQKSEIVFHFDAVKKAAFYSLSPDISMVMRRIFDRLVLLEMAKSIDFEAMYRNYLATRDFDSARLFLKKYPALDLPMLPEISLLVSSEKVERFEWQVSAVGRTLAQREVFIPMGPFVLILASPQCGFSRTALHDIFSDKHLKGLISQRTRLMVPPDYNFDFSGVQAWNDLNPSMKMSIIDKRSDWPEIREWETPTFYFYRDRRLVSMVIGWPRPSGNKDELIAAFRKIGVN